MNFWIFRGAVSQEELYFTGFVIVIRVRG